MNWSQFAAGQPRLAALAQEKLLDPGVVLVGTIRSDGTPRISPVEPYLLDDDLLLSMLWGSTKAADLLRDPRILVHSIITNRNGEEGEVKIRGLTRAEDNPEVQSRYAAAVRDALGWDPVPGRFHLFAVRIEQVSYLRYDNATGDQHTAVWPPVREFVRRGTSPTSLGDPEPVTDILVAS
jgi:Pyridoxamine 5'-phosphate oxidase